MSHSNSTVDPVQVARIQRRRARHLKSYDPLGTLLPRLQRLQRIHGFTHEAQRTTHPVGIISQTNWNFLRRTRKSGLTPVPTDLRIQLAQSAEERERDIRARWTQRRIFHGFSSLELQEMDSLIYKDNDNSGSTLINPIHPAFQKPRWLTERHMGKNKGAIPIYGDSDKFWSVDNDDVWKILEPCCRLASIVLESASQYQWVDALVHDNVREIPNTDPNDGYLEEFFPRPIESRSRAGEGLRLDRLLIGIASKIRIVLFSGCTDPQTDLPTTGQTSDGQHVGSSTGAYELVCISIESLHSLLRTDICPAERLQCTWVVASTLLHEFMHAVGQLIRNQRPRTSPKSSYEPFYEGEELSELGFSFEDKIWGGFAKDCPFGENLNRGGPGLVRMAVLKSNWFRECHSNYLPGAYPVVSRKPAPLNPNDNVFHQFDHWPVPTSWVKNLFQPWLWQDVKARGVEAAYLGPLTVGTRRIAGEPRIPAVFRMLHESVLGNRFPTSSISIGDSPEVVRLKQEEARRVQRRWDISHAIGAGILENDALSNDFDQGGSETEDDIEEEVYDCPRWDEITQYLFANRAPLQLGLDSMTIISEPTFYRYIRDYGGIDLTPREFRDFLGTANARGQLFLYEAFPGVGCLMRIDAGWPPLIFPHLLPPPDNPVPDDMISDLSAFIESSAVRNYVYGWFKEPGDIGLNQLWGALDGIFDTSNIPRDRLRDALIEYMDDDSVLVTFGPEGIVRFLWTEQELLNFQAEWPTPFRLRMIESWEHRAHRCLAIWEGRTPTPFSTPSDLSPSPSPTDSDGDADMDIDSGGDDGGNDDGDDDDGADDAGDTQMSGVIDTGTGQPVDTGGGTKRPRDDDDDGLDQRKATRRKIGTGTSAGGN